MSKKKYSVCVYGASSQSIDPSFLLAGQQLGEGIAERGWRLVFGAGQTGMMGAAAQGAARKDGTITGIAPFFFNQPGVLYQSGDDLLFTRTMRERKAFMESLSNGFIVTPGGVGTLEEFYEILTLKQLGQLFAPLVILNTNGFYDELLKCMETMCQKQFITPETLTLYHVAGTPEEALQWLEQEFQRLERASVTTAD